MTFGFRTWSPESKKEKCHRLKSIPMTNKMLLLGILVILLK